MSIVKLVLEGKLTEAEEMVKSTLDEKAQDFTDSYHASAFASIFEGVGKPSDDEDEDEPKEKMDEDKEGKEDIEDESKEKDDADSDEPNEPEDKE